MEFSRRADRGPPARGGGGGGGFGGGGGPGGPGGREMRCYECGEIGHIARDCRNMRGGPASLRGGPPPPVRGRSRSRSPPRRSRSPSYDRRRSPRCAVHVWWDALHSTRLTVSQTYISAGLGVKLHSYGVMYLY